MSWMGQCPFGTLIAGFSGVVNPCISLFCDHSYLPASVTLVCFARIIPEHVSLCRRCVYCVFCSSNRRDLERGALKTTQVSVLCWRGTQRPLYMCRGQRTIWGVNSHLPCASSGSNWLLDLVAGTFAGPSIYLTYGNCL